MAHLPPLPEGWEERRDNQGNVFFVDHVSQTTSWIDPRQRPTHGTSTPGATLSPPRQGNSTATLSSAPGQMSTPIVEHPPGSMDFAAVGAGGDHGLRGATATGSPDLSRDDVTFSPHLIPDDDRSECFICKERFTALRRRHHCRSCGEIVCAACSPDKKIIPVAEAGYDRPRRVCAPCSAHLSAGDYTCPARYAVAIATPGADTYHKHGAIRHLSAAMEAAAKKTRPNIAVNGNASGSRVASGPLAALLRVHGGPTAFFAALSPMLSTEVPLDVCTHACQLVGASLLLASRMGTPETWVWLVSAIPDEAVDRLLECLRVAPARAKAARALFYAAKAPQPGGAGGELIEARSGVQIMLEVLEPLPTTTTGSGTTESSATAPSASAGLSVIGLRMWLCATLQPVVAGRPRAARALVASGGISLLCRQLKAGPADVAVQACGVLASTLGPENRRGRDDWPGGLDAVGEAVESGVIPPLLGMLSNKKNDAHASALAMELLVILSGQPRFFDQLRLAGTIPAVVACLEDHPAGAREASTGSNISLVQSVLTVLANFLRGCSDKKEGVDTMAEIGAMGADLRLVSFLSARDAMTRKLAAELALQLALQGRPAPAPAFDPSASRIHDVAKVMISAGALGALWALCSDTHSGTRSVALEALATLLGTAAAMSRSTASSEAVLSLVAQDAVGRLAREHIHPALAVLRGSTPSSGMSAHDATAGAFEETVAVATSALLALHFLAVNPDPAVYGLFLPAAGVDDPGNNVSGSRTGGTTWDTILTSVERAVEGRASPAFVEAALLAAGSVCGAPPLPALSGEPQNQSTSSPAEDVSRILATYDRRTKSQESLVAASSATARGLVTQAMLLLSGLPTSSVPESFAVGDVVGLTAAKAAGVAKAKTIRAAVRVVWALSKGPSSATLAAQDILLRLMELASARRRSGAGGRFETDSSASVLILDTISTFLTIDEQQPRADSSSISPETAATMSRTVEDLCALVLEGAGNGGAGDQSMATDPLGPRSLSLLATAAKNPMLRPILLSSPRLPAVLDFLLMEKKHLDESSPSRDDRGMTLAALNVVRIAISDESTALRLAKLGLVFKLATIVRQTSAGPPPPLPPRGGEGDLGKRNGHSARGSSGVASPSASPPSSPLSKAARREEAQAALAVLAGLAEHDSCVPLMLESGDLGCLFQVIRNSASTTDEGVDSSDRTGVGFGFGAGLARVKAERRVEVEEALRCLLLLTARRERSLHRALGLVAGSSLSSGRIQALFDLAFEEGGIALQVVFQLVAGESSRPASSSPILGPLSEDPRLRVVQRLLGPAAFAFPEASTWGTTSQGSGESPSRRREEALVRVARARACDALRYACQFNAKATKPAVAMSSDATDGENSPLKSKDSGGSEGGESAAEAGDNANAIVASEATDGVGGLDVDVVVGLVPSVLALAGTVEGARCLRVMVSRSGRIVEESVCAAILRGVDEAAMGGKGTVRGIRAVVQMLTSRRAEVRAAGAYILRVFTWPPSSAATASLLESLGACGGRPEAIRLLVKLDLFGEENESSGEGSSGLDGGRGDGTRGGGNGGGRRSPDASKEKEEAYWRRWSREDGTAVLMSLVTAVTASGSGTAAEGGGLKIRGGRTRESDGSLTEGREGNAAVARGNGGREGFSVQEQEALSSVCVEALRALATDALKGSAEKARCLSLLADLALDPVCARTLFRQGVVSQMLLNAQGCSHAVPKHARGRRSGSGSGGGSLPFLSPRRANGSNEDSDGRQPPSPTDGPGGRVAVEREAGASGKPADAEETLASVSAGNGNEQEENASIASVELCRCRRVVRVLARLVRGLPREAPAVVVKRGGIRSIVQILEDAARVAAAEAEAGAESAGEEEALEDEKGGDKSARTHAAAAEVLELFVALSEQSPHRRALVNVPGLLQAASSYVVSTTKTVTTAAPAPSATETEGCGQGDVNGHDEGIVALRSSTDSTSDTQVLDQATSPQELLQPSKISTSVSKLTLAKPGTELAFRLLGNLASTDGPRRRIMEIDGVVLAAATTVRVATTVTPSSSLSSSMTATTGEAAAGLLGRLAPVLGAEGSEDQLVATGKALSSAVCAAARHEIGVGSEVGGEDKEGGRTGAVVAGAESAGGVGDVVSSFFSRPGLGLALEALSGLLVLSWSDASSLEAAAAVDEVVTDPLLARSVVSLWRRDMAVGSRTVATAAAVGSMSSVALGFLSSVAWRPAGRQALVSGGAVSALVEAGCGRRGAQQGEDPRRQKQQQQQGQQQQQRQQQRHSLSTDNRSEILRLLCVLCASPMYRAIVRASLVDCVEREGGTGGGSSGDVDDEEYGDAVKAAIVRVQGGSLRKGEGTMHCCTEANRLALLLGVALPPPPVPMPVPAPVRVPSSNAKQIRDPVTAFCGNSSVSNGARGAAASATLASRSQGRSSPSRTNDRKVKPATESRSPTNHSEGIGGVVATAVALPERRRDGEGGGGGGGTQDADATTMDWDDLEEALFPTVSAVDVAAEGRASPLGQDTRGAITPPAMAREAVSRFERDRGRTQHVATVVAAPVAIPVRDDSFLNGSRAGTQQPARPSSSSYPRENLDRMMSALSTGERGGVSRQEASRSGTTRGVRPPGGVNNGAGGGRAASGQVDDRISCRLCGGVLYAPKGFDLALLDCPHCHRPMA